MDNKAIDKIQIPLDVYAEMLRREALRQAKLSASAFSSTDREVILKTALSIIQARMSAVGQPFVDELVEIYNKKPPSYLYPSTTPIKET